jgi:hypothetical protein
MKTHRGAMMSQSVADSARITSAMIRPMRRAAALILAIWITGLAGALAQQAQHVSPIALTTPNVGASSVQVAGPNSHRAGLYVFNPSPTITLWVSPTGTPAAVNGAGSIAIQPLQRVMFGPPNTPPWINGMNAVAPSGASNSISILEY